MYENSFSTFFLVGARSESALRLRGRIRKIHRLRSTGKITAALAEQLTREARVVAQQWASVENRQRTSANSNIETIRDNAENINPRELEQRERASRSPNFMQCEYLNSPTFTFLSEVDRADLSRHLQELAIREDNCNLTKNNYNAWECADSSSVGSNRTSTENLDGETIAAIDALLYEYL